VKRIEKALKNSQQKTLGRVMKIPERGSRLNRIGWFIFFVLAFLATWLLLDE
jgi:hypothetical protein